MPLNRKGGPWEGGYISIGARGRTTYVIERQVRGSENRFHVSTRAHTRRVALEHLARFEANPFDYRPEGVEAELPLVMTTELIREHWKFSRDTKKNTSRHANAVLHRLEDWQRWFGARDLRRLSLRDHIKPHLKAHNAKHLIIALKSFFGWLRTERNLLTSAQDPTLDLKVPQAMPEKHVRRKAVAWENVAAAAKKLEGDYRQVLEVLVATGMHYTELGRFVRNPDSELREGKGEVLAVLVCRHKSGAWTRIPLTVQASVDAARALRARGTLPKKPNLALARACLKAKVDAFKVGVIRHSVATWWIERGATPDQVAEFLGHKDKRTTLRFYADVAVPTRTVPVIALPAFEPFDGGAMPLGIRMPSIAEATLH